MKKIVLLIGILFTINAFGCGCEDAQKADDAANAVNDAYNKQDQQLAQALTGLGNAVKTAYTYMGQSAQDIERIARLRKAQVLAMQNIAFESKKINDELANVANIQAVGVEKDMLSAEKTAVKRQKKENEK